MIARKKFRGKVYEIECSRFGRSVGARVDGVEAVNVGKNCFRAVFPKEVVQFRTEGSFMTGMDLVFDGFRFEIFRHIKWYEYLFVFLPLFLLGVGAVLGIEQGVTTQATVTGGVVGVLLGGVGFFVQSCLVHSSLKKPLKIVCCVAVLLILAAAMTLVWVFFGQIAELFGFGV